MAAIDLEDAARYAAGLGMTPDQLRVIARLMESDQPTLGEMLEAAWARHAGPDLSRYPAPARYLLDGRAGLAGMPAAAGHWAIPTAPDVPGFRDLTYRDFTLPRVHEAMLGIGLISGVKDLRRRRRAGRPAATPDPTRLGVGVMEAFAIVARKVGAWLTAEHLCWDNPVKDLQPPRRPAADGRVKYLTPTQTCEYFQAILMNSRDPRRDVAFWLLGRLGALRLRESCDTLIGKCRESNGTVTGRGKGNREYTVFVHRPVLGWMLEQSAARPGHGDDAALVRTRRGAPMRRQRVEAWSDALLDSCDWAVEGGRRYHVLRHTTAKQAFGSVRDPVPLAHFLRHQPRSRYGTVIVYIDGCPQDAIGARRYVAEHTFGPLDRWPEHLPENTILRRILGPHGPWARQTFGFVS